MLSIDGLRGGYGGPPVLQGLALAVERGEVVGILGRNGMGKSTLLRAIMGLLPEFDGQIAFDGRAVLGLPTHQIARIGIAYIPQGRGIFPRLSVRENLEAGTKAWSGGSRSDLPPAIFDYFPILRQRLGQSGGTLSGGEQQMLAIARALCGRPKLLLMDEPSDGIQPSIVDMLAALIPGIARQENVGVVLVEQNLDLALSAASRCFIMQRGAFVQEGTPADFSDAAMLRRHLAI
jgi:urea ABC transporter ATP-binding protein UrtE